MRIRVLRFTLLLPALFTLVAVGLPAAGDGPDAVMPCPGHAAKPAAIGRIADPAINEASGLAVSRTQKKVLWVHNDSGDIARLFAIRPDGRLLGVFLLVGAKAWDWEDMAAGPCPGGGECLYAGDIGDNFLMRDTVVVHRLPEPKIRKAAGGDSVRISGYESFTLTYPDGARDAETLLADPVRGDLLIVTRSVDGRSEVYRANLPEEGGEGEVGLEKVADLAFEDLGLRGSNIATGGDVDASGRKVVIRTYTHAYLWSRPEGEPLWAAFANPPCRIDLVEERQGETLALTPDGKGFYTLSEGRWQPVWGYGRARR